MRTLYTIITLAPAPLFFLGFLYSVFAHMHHSWEMPLMWIIMSLAHLTPWILHWQQRNLTRD